MDERKLELLKRLEAYFNEDEDIEEVSIFTKEELNAPMDVLRVFLTDYGPGLMEVLVENSFLPLQETEVLYFNTVITIKLDIPEEAVSALSCAIAKLNFFLPYGAFSINGDGSMLVYKSTTAVLSKDDDDALYEQIQLSADTAILAAEGYTEQLSQVADGSLLLSDFLETLPEV